ncbi:MAG TPA: hypothetical protein VEQ35_08810 [Beijerinckia sp.]|nr:hypothetical protein [Beijerinckia sp.]
MIFALGFLIAGLIALAIAPAFWHRSIRLSTRRLEMQLPLSARELFAERDFIRAEAAVDRRRIEQKLEALNRTHIADMTEIGRREWRIAGLETQVASLGALNSTQRAELAFLKESLAQFSAELDATAHALSEMRDVSQQQSIELQRLEDVEKKLQATIDEQNLSLAKSAVDLAKLLEECTAQTARASRIEDELDAVKTTSEAARKADLVKRDGLGQELAAPRPAAQTPVAEQEENAVLRQNINEIGAAIIRMAKAGLATPPAAEAGAQGDREAGRDNVHILPKAGASSR